MHKTFEVREMLLVSGGRKPHMVPYRLAKPKEIKKAQAAAGAPHVTFGCTCCGIAGWSAKNLALNDDGTYNGIRRIFWGYSGPECKCPTSALRLIVEVVNQPARQVR